MKVLCIQTETLNWMFDSASVIKGKIYTVVNVYTKQDIFKAIGVMPDKDIFYELQCQPKWVFASDLFVEISDLSVDELIEQKQLETV
jgi:hypothetical protein